MRATVWLWLALVATAAAEGPSPAPWSLTIEAAFVRPALHEPVPGASTAILCAARPDGHGGLEYATTRAAWRLARERGEREGAAWLGALQREMMRNREGVVTHGLLTGTTPLTPAVVLTPAFRAEFEPIFGPDFLVVIPDRYTVGIFPRLAGGIPPEVAGALANRHFVSAEPVSREVFRVTRDGIRAEGTLEP